MTTVQPAFDAGQLAKAAAALEVLRRIEKDYSPATLSCSFAAESMTLVDMICRHKLGIEIFTLDTGRLPEETYELMHRVKQHYGVDIKIMFPQTAVIQDFVRKNGMNPFRPAGEQIIHIDALRRTDDTAAVKAALAPFITMRQACCGIRKVEPLQRALAGKKAWLTGLRRAQSVTRKELQLQEYDADHRLAKFNPLVDWSEKDVWAYVHHFGVPYNELHDRGYPSVGCAPCSRAIAMGEDIRAGRWWWEDPESKECGLHVRKKG
ncbi:MAG: phosphoadenylyl-sulfate reductase [Nevskiales bacterium]